MTLIEGKRGQIIEAAITEFRERGFAGASMDRVAALARVSKRTVYNHFESKDALFRDILDMMADEATASFVLAYDAKRPIAEQLVALGWTQGRLMTDPDFMKLARMVICETIRDAELAVRASGKMDSTGFIRGFLGEATTAGALEIENLQRATTQFLGLIKAQAFWPGIYSGAVLTRDEMAAVIDSTVAMFLKQYGTAAAREIAAG